MNYKFWLYGLMCYLSKKNCWIIANCCRNIAKKMLEILRGPRLSIA